MITQFITANKILEGEVHRTNFNIPLRLLRMSDLIRMRINPNMTRTDFIQAIFLEFVHENQMIVDEILEDYEITIEEL